MSGVLRRLVAQSGKTTKPARKASDAERTAKAEAGKELASALGLDPKKVDGAALCDAVRTALNLTDDDDGE